MAMSDCEKCWDTPCRCGWGYRNWTKESIDKFIKILERTRDGESPWLDKA